MVCGNSADGYGISLIFKNGVKGFKIDLSIATIKKQWLHFMKLPGKRQSIICLLITTGCSNPPVCSGLILMLSVMKVLKAWKIINGLLRISPRYIVSIPYIRMMAGPMDYTPGAMRNAVKANFRPINDNPMSQGTRCSQLAMYVIYEARFKCWQIIPTIYMREQECTDFITKVPTTFDETVPIDGIVGEVRSACP